MPDHSILFLDPSIEVTLPYQMDAGLQFGLGCFETILIRDKVFFLEEHLTRLNQSLGYFGMGCSISRDAVEALIQKQDLKHVALKLIVTEKNCFALVRPLPYGALDYHKGKKVTISRVIKSKYSSLVSHKTLNYGDNMWELKRAKQSGYDDCLFLNEEGHMTESCVANLFLVQDEQLITAPSSDGLLPGIIRNKIIEQFPVRQKHITRSDVMSCQAAFLTNSLLGAMHITQIDERNHFEEHHLIRQVKQFLGDVLPRR